MRRITRTSRTLVVTAVMVASVVLAAAFPLIALADNGPTGHWSDRFAPQCTEAGWPPCIWVALCVRVGTEQLERPVPAAHVALEVEQSLGLFAQRPRLARLSQVHEDLGEIEPDLCLRVEPVGGAGEAERLSSKRLGFRRLPASREGLRKHRSPQQVRVCVVGRGEVAGAERPVHGLVDAALAVDRLGQLGRTGGKISGRSPIDS